MKDKIENRLLTDEDGHEFRRDNDILLDITAEDAFDYGFEQGAKEQDAKASSIKDAECKQKGGRELMDFIDRTFSKNITIDQMMATNTWQLKKQELGE